MNLVISLYNRGLGHGSFYEELLSTFVHDILWTNSIICVKFPYLSNIVCTLYCHNVLLLQQIYSIRECLLIF